MSSPAEAIKAVLEESGPDYDDFSFEEMAGGTRADVYFVTLTYEGNSYEVVVKFAPESAVSFAVEPYLHDFIAERTEVPIPGILVFEQEPSRDIRPYFVTERMRGDNLDDSFESLSLFERQHLMQQVGEILGNLHSTVAFEGYGRLGLDDGRLIVRNLSGDWQEYFAEMTHGHVDLLEGTTFEGFQERARERIDDNLSTVPRHRVPRLVHDDFRPGNLLFDDGDQPIITTVLDWEPTLAGDPLYNLAEVEFLFIDSVFRDQEEQTVLRDALYDGYRSEVDFEPDEEYETVKPLYQFSTLIWRMAGFDELYGDEGPLAKSRAEAYYRQHFDELAATIANGD